MTIRRLVLVRHAKAAADGDSDAERPLAKRGKADAPAIGRWLTTEGIMPDRVVVSPARRAMQTWELAARELGSVPEPVRDERLYANTVEDLLAVTRDTPAEVRTLVLVGHNPGIEEVAIALDDGSADATGRQAMTEKFATSGIAVFDLGVDWADAKPGTGRLVDFVVPRG